MDTSNKQLVVKSLLTTTLPYTETIATVAVYESVSEGIRKLIGEYDITLLDEFITNSNDPKLLLLLIDKLASI
jgi:hypothetical protein